MTAPITETGRPGGRRFRLDDRYRREEGVVHLSGIQALVRILLDRSRRDNTNGLRTATFVSGYEGSPLAGYDIELGRRGALLHEHDIVHKPGLNEELAATAVMGSQLAGQVGASRCDGVVGIWYGKSPGLDRASDALRHANLVEPALPAVPSRWSATTREPSRPACRVPARRRSRTWRSQRCTRPMPRTSSTSGSTRSSSPGSAACGRA